jgi:Tol biopolymer transport system component/DNA-binding winged helix-turn-helix (wHTH) protein
VASRYQWDDFVLDLDAYRLERGGVPLSLEPKAFNLLVLMVQRPGHLFTKQEIFEALWTDTAVTDHALTRVVAQLRRVLGDEAREARYLETVPTRGYRWIRPVVPVAPPAPLAPMEPVEPVAPMEPMEPMEPRLSSITAAVVLGLTALGFLGWAQRQVPASAVEATADPGHGVNWPVQFTTHGGLDFQPAMSPHGDAIAFASDRAGAIEIFIKGRGNGAVETALTANGGQNVQPAWSPDGDVIAYHSMRDGGIWIVAARGGTPRQLSAFGSRPAWSADGRRIAFQSGDSAEITPYGATATTGSTLWIMDRDGSNARALTSPGRPMGGHASPNWSHDGRFLVFSVFDSGGRNGIWIAPAGGGEPQPLDLGYNLYDPLFARDDSAVYAAGGEALIVKLPFDAASGRRSGPRQVIPVSGVPGVRGLSLAADGRSLGFGGLALNSQIWTIPLRTDGSPAGPTTAITNDTSRRNSFPVLSPDGRRLAYVSTRRGERPNVWVMDLAGSSAVQLTSDENSEHEPAWSRDGRRVAYLSRKGDVGGLWSLDTTTRREELVVDLGRPGRVLGIESPLGEVALASSMTQVAFSLLAPPSGMRAMYVSPTATPAPRRLTADGISAGYPAWSPDERTLAVEIMDGQATHAAVIDVATGTLRQLTDEPGQTWVRSWSPDGTRIAIAAQRRGQWHLGWVDARTGRLGAFAPPERPRVYVRYPDWSAHGDRLVYERGETRGNIWTMVLD